MKKRILIDTGPIVALFSSADQHHNACVQQLQENQQPLLTCWPVISEAAWLLRRQPAALHKLLSSFGGRLFDLLPLGETDLPEVSAILTKYRDLQLDLADAALLHLANREGIETVFTLDRRDFSVMRLTRGKKLRLVP